MQNKRCDMQSNKRSKNKEQILKITYLALLTALVFVIQLLGGSIKVGGLFSITLVLLPIVLGAVLVGPLGGAWLGFVFALAVFYTGDAAAFLAVSPFGTIVTVVLKGVLAGLMSGLVYKALPKERPFLRAFVAAAVCPLVNTGIFFLGCVAFFLPTIEGWAQGLGFASAGEYMVFGLAGINFVVELVTNILLVPILVRLVSILERQIGIAK